MRKKWKPCTVLIFVAVCRPVEPGLVPTGHRPYSSIHVVYSAGTST